MGKEVCFMKNTSLNVLGNNHAHINSHSSRFTKIQKTDQVFNLLLCSLIYQHKPAVSIG